MGGGEIAPSHYLTHQVGDASTGRFTASQRTADSDWLSGHDFGYSVSLVH
jgi:hypothetical protein